MADPPHIHVWSLDGESHVLTAHIIMEKDPVRDDITRVKQSIRDLLHPEDFTHLTLYIEMPGEPCASSDGSLTNETSPSDHFQGL